MSSQYGFNTFGGISRWLVAELGYEYREILDIINWATNDCEEPTLIRVASKNSQGTVGGIVFAPGENALCYKKFVRSHHSKPYRNFFYNVTFEAYSVLGDLIPEPEDSVSIGSFAAIGVSELSGGTNGHPDIVKAQVEAFYHYCEHRPDVAIDRLRLFGCISGKAFESIAELLPTLKGTTHRRIQVEKGRTGQFDTFVLRGFAPAAV